MFDYEEEHQKLGRSLVKSIKANFCHKVPKEIKLENIMESKMDDQYCYDGQFSDLSRSLYEINKTLEKIHNELVCSNANLFKIINASETNTSNQETIFLSQQRNFEMLREILQKGTNGLAKTDNV